MLIIMNGLLNIVLFQNGFIIGEIQGKNRFSTPRFHWIYLKLGMNIPWASAFIEMKSFINFLTHLLNLKKPIFLLWEIVLKENKGKIC